MNIVLDLVFLVGLHSGVAGAGYATVISQGISGLLCLFYLYKKFEIMRFQQGECRLELKRCSRLLSIGLPMALQFSITAIGSIILQTSVNSLGSLAVTSVTAAQKICAIVMGPLESLGITMATFCGQNLGAKKFYRIRDGIRLSMYVSMCYCAFCIAFLWILGKYTAYLFLDPSETEVIQLAVQYMRLNAIFYPVLGVLFILRNSLQGMGYSLMPMMAGVSELAARSLVCFGFVPTFGYMAAVMASPVAWIFADVLLITVYFVDMRKLKRQLLPAEAAVPGVRVSTETHPKKDTFMKKFISLISAAVFSATLVLPQTLAFSAAAEESALEESTVFDTAAAKPTRFRQPAPPTPCPISCVSYRNGISSRQKKLPPATWSFRQLCISPAALPTASAPLW